MSDQTTCSIADKHCVPCHGGIPPMTNHEIQNAVKQLSKDWQVSENHQSIHRDFKFKNYYQTIAFVNAIAWMAHIENHHPDLEVSYNHCVVRYTTHAINGLSDNDFICAEKIDALFLPFAGKTV